MMLAAVVATFLAAPVTTGVYGFRGHFPNLIAGYPSRYPPVAPTMPAGAAEAGRWLRAHFDPRDVVATNSHCRLSVAGCDSRDFWLSA